MWSGSTTASNFFWLENNGAVTVIGINSDGSVNTSTKGISTSAEIKALVSNGTFSSSNWAVNANINNGYPHLTVFDNTTIWGRDDNINNGYPYLKENLPT